VTLVKDLRFLQFAKS